jgi:hypothetical protein
MAPEEDGYVALTTQRYGSNGKPGANNADKHADPFGQTAHGRERHWRVARTTYREVFLKAK